MMMMMMMMMMMGVTTKEQKYSSYCFGLLKDTFRNIANNQIF